VTSPLVRRSDASVVCLTVAAFKRVDGSREPLEFAGLDPARDHALEHVSQPSLAHVSKGR
jgi:hypothetical protein